MKRFILAGLLACFINMPTFAIQERSENILIGENCNVAEITPTQWRPKYASPLRIEQALPEDLINEIYAEYMTRIRNICDDIFFRLNARNVAPNSLVVFDVDGTALYASSGLKKLNPYHRFRLLPPIEYVLALYKKLVELGYKIIFLTGRQLQQPQAFDVTNYNLNASGYKIFKQLIMYPYSFTPEVSEDDQCLQISEWKKSQLEDLVKNKGYTLCGFIDDEPLNIDPDNPNHFKIPNLLTIEYEARIYLDR